MSEKKLWQLSACDLAERIATGDVSAMESVSSAVERMHARNGQINAVVDDLSEAALARAKQLDSARHGRP